MIMMLLKRRCNHESERKASRQSVQTERNNRAYVDYCSEKKTRIKLMHANNLEKKSSGYLWMYLKGITRTPTRIFHGNSLTTVLSPLIMLQERKKNGAFFIDGMEQ